MKIMKTKLTTIILLSLLLICCKKDDSIKTSDKVQSNLTISSIAQSYLSEVLNIMESNSIFSSTIDWAFLKNEVFKTVATAQTINDTYPGIRKALTLLGDNHSHYITPSGGIIYVFDGPSVSTEDIAIPVIPEDVGYVKVSSFAGQSNDASAIAFANQIQNQIERQDHVELKGWIVDLRNNSGGNMWPMLAGIGPILGEGVAGYFIFPSGSEISWAFQNGASEYAGYPVTKLEKSYKLLVPNPKVGVLLNSGVASSGEAIAISFIGRDNTKSFGSATRGLSTANTTFVLSDNAILNLTTAYMADRNRKIYGVPVYPDITSSVETIIYDVITWIQD